VPNNKTGIHFRRNSSILGVEFTYPKGDLPAFVAQRIEHLTTDQKVGGSSPSKRTILPLPSFSLVEENRSRLREIQTMSM